MGTLRLATRGSPLALRQTELVSELLRQAHPRARRRGARGAHAGRPRRHVAARPDRGPGRVRHRGGGGRGRRTGRRRSALGQGHALGDAGEPRAGRGATAGRPPRRARGRHAWPDCRRAAWWPRVRHGGGRSWRRCAPISCSPTCGGTWPAAWPWPRRARSRPWSSRSPPWSAWAGWTRCATCSTPSTCCRRRDRAPSRCSAGQTTPARRELLAAIDHGPSHRALRAERAVLAALGGNCTLPVGAFAETDGTGGGPPGVGAPGQRGRAHVIRMTRPGDDPEAVGRGGGARPGRGGRRGHRRLRRLVDASP